MNTKRILAIIAIILLAAMYAATFIFALCDFPGSDALLKGFLLLDVIVPVFAWMLMYVYKHFGSHDSK